MLDDYDFTEEENHIALVEMIGVHATTPDGRQRAAYVYMLSENPEKDPDKIEKSKRKTIINRRGFTNDYCVYMEDSVGRALCLKDSEKDFDEAMRAAEDDISELVTLSDGWSTRTVFAESLTDTDVEQPILTHTGGMIAYSVQFEDLVANTEHAALIIIQAIDEDDTNRIRAEVDDIRNDLAEKIRDAEAEGDIDEIYDLLDSFVEYICDEIGAVGVYQIPADIIEQAEVVWDPENEEPAYSINRYL